MWSSGRIHEDDCGQRVMWAYSDDRLFAFYVEAEYRKEDMQGPNFRPATNTPWLYFRSYVRALNPDGVSWGDPSQTADRRWNWLFRKMAMILPVPGSSASLWTNWTKSIPHIKENKHEFQN